MKRSNSESKCREDVPGFGSKHEGLTFNPRVGLGSTDNENIALRRNHRELELLCRKQKMLGIEQEYVMKIIDLHSKTTQVNYRRLTKRVGRIRSHLTEKEIKEMENDARKREFANKYRNILRNHTTEGDEARADGESDQRKQNSENVTDRQEDRVGGSHLSILKEKDEGADARTLSQSPEKTELKSQTSHGLRPSSGRERTNETGSNRPKTAPNHGSKSGEQDDEGLDEIIPSLENLIDQLHNIKPQQFYENQRKLKLYDIQLFLEELETRKEALFKNVDAIINWDKKKEVDEEEEERKKKEEEESKKPQKRKTTFMRSVLRNFSMELMMKTMQYGWADIGKCRYLRKRGGDDDEEGANTLAKDTMKIQMPNEEPDENATSAQPRIEPGFGPDGKMIRTADLLGLKS